MNPTTLTAPDLAPATIEPDRAAESTPGDGAMRISAVLIAQDEAGCIANAVASCLPFCDEVLVIDGGSQDNTVQVATQAGARVVHHPWPGYAKQRNYGAEQAQFPWVFMIDADEVVGEALAASIENIQSTEPQQGAFALLRVGDFFDRWMWERADRHIRLYDKRRYRFKNVLVHETLDVGDDPIGQLDGILWHHGFRDLDNLVVRFNRYTKLEAVKAYEAGRRFRLSRLLWRAPARVGQVYLLKGGWKRGAAGLGVTAMWLMYELLTELKLWEQAWLHRGRPHEPVQDPVKPVQGKLVKGAG
ncbi:MAG: glycosyltransferase family 2 protein [Planctomycetota bacterium]